VDFGPLSLARPGQVIAGRYRIERLLARGGSGAVFVAEQLSTDAKVALKLLLPHILESEEARRRFEFEAKVAGRVQSEFIVRTIDAGVDEDTDQPFLAMELLDGYSFAERVRRLGPWAPADVALHVGQLASGLDKAHAHETKEGKLAPIVHCDLKPENLFLATREDGVPITKILDFGVAKVVSDTLAITRGVVGSPLYIAYEQLTSGSITPKTDIWAMGLIAFFMLSGRAYWRAASSSNISVSAIFAEVLSMDIVPPTERAMQLEFTPGWSPAFDAWFLRCVNRDQGARFETAGAAADALTAALLDPDSAKFSVRPLMNPAPPAVGLETTDRILPVSSEQPAQRTSLTPRNVARGALGLGATGALVVALLLARDKPAVGEEETVRSSRNPELNFSRAPAPPPPPVAPVVLPPLASAVPSASASAAPPRKLADKAADKRSETPDARSDFKRAGTSPPLDSPVYDER
jgi:serine/threonine-protein kinase